MKYGMKLGNIEIEEIKVENIEINVECSMQETAEAYKLLRQALKDAPEIMTDLANAFVAFENIQGEINKYIHAQNAKNEMLEQAKRVIADAMKASM